MTRKFNFSAGPAGLPEEVLAQAQQELLDWHGKGLSIMEMSHRSDEFVSVAEQAEQDLRDLMGISSAYKVLFLQGGATSQFSMIPMNLLRGKTNADYINTGIWSKKRSKKRLATVMSLLQATVKETAILPYRPKPNLSLTLMRLTFTTRPMKPLVDWSMTIFQNREMYLSWLIFLLLYCPVSWMWISLD